MSLSVSIISHSNALNLMSFKTLVSARIILISSCSVSISENELAMNNLPVVTSWPILSLPLSVLVVAIYNTQYHRNCYTSILNLLMRFNHYFLTMKDNLPPSTSYLRCGMLSHFNLELLDIFDQVYSLRMSSDFLLDRCYVGLHLITE